METSKINYMADLRVFLNQTAKPVILFESIQEVLREDRDKLTRFAFILANEFPHATFRSMSAPGTFDAFAAGISLKDPSRLQRTIRENALINTNNIIQETEPEELAFAEETIGAYSKRISSRHKAPVQQLSMWDDAITLTRSNNHKLAPVSVGIFYVNYLNRYGGAIGQSMRECNKKEIPVITQDRWLRWFNL